jgi:hypothetical protein
VEVDKRRQLVTVFDKDAKIIAVYPATVGSDEKPSPSGVLKVAAIRKNPTYRYDPAFRFKGVRSKVPFIIAAGPNNPLPWQRFRSRKNSPVTTGEKIQLAQADVRQ